jgi:hypothetical protein
MRFSTQIILCHAKQKYVHGWELWCMQLIIWINDISSWMTLTTQIQLAIWGMDYIDEFWHYGWN